MQNVADLLWFLQCLVLPAVFVLVSMAWVLHYSERISTPAIGDKKTKPLMQGQQSEQLTRMQMHLSFFETRVSSLEKRLSLLEKKVSLVETRLLTF